MVGSTRTPGVRRSITAQFLGLVLGTVVCTFLTGCGPTVTKGTLASQQTVRTIAILPVASTDPLPRERTDYLMAALRREFDGTGFVVLDPKIVREVCDSNPCPNAKALGDKYHVDAVADLTVGSVQRANFIVGNYNSIGGVLTLSTPSGEKLYTIDHQESEHGGLLFSSGQVIEGLKQTVAGYGDQKFGQVADRFVKQLVLALPKVPSAAGDAFQVGNAPSIQSVSVNSAGAPARYRVCARGSTNATAQLLIGSRRAGLRETKGGEYCGVFPLGWLTTSTSESRVELRSPYGVSVVKDLDTLMAGICDPTKGVQQVNGTLARSCIGSGCSGEVQSCRDARLIVFSAPDEGGPFQRVGELPERGMWRESSTQQPVVYAVVAVSPDGAVSMPAVFNTH